MSARVGLWADAGPHLDASVVNLAASQASSSKFPAGFFYHRRCIIPEALAPTELTIPVYAIIP